MVADFKAWLQSGPTPNTLAYFDDKNQVMSQKFSLLVCHYTRQLIESKQQTWLVYSDNSGLFSIGFIAALLAGKRILLPANTQSKTISEMLQHVDGVISSDSSVNTNTHANKINSIDEKDYLYLDDKQEIQNESVAWPQTKKLGEIILFTSGSNGEAKKVPKSVTQLANEVTVLEDTFACDLSPTCKTVLATVSHQHIYGLLFKVVWPLVTGRAFYQPLIQYPETLFAKLISDSSAIIISSPAFLARLPEPNLISGFSSRTKYEGLIFSSGGPLSYSAAQMTHECFHQHPTEVFGSTETGGIGYRQQQKQDSPWQAFRDIEISSETQSQRLLIRSPYLETSNWYPCDDKVTISNKNQFQLLGRMDRIVKLEEKRVSITAIEKILEQHPSINDTAIVLLNRTRAQLAAIVVLNDAGFAQLATQGKLKFSQNLRRYLLTYFEAVTLPRRWRFVSDIPLSSQGKRNSDTLCELFEND